MEDVACAIIIELSFALSQGLDVANDSSIFILNWFLNTGVPYSEGDNCSANLNS
jgi:hypothetical protein